MTEQEHIEEIADVYGLESQLAKLREELSELLSALDGDDVGNVVEEMADVTIMIRQLVYLLHAESAFDAAVEWKIERQTRRINKHERAADANESAQDGSTGEFDSDCDKNAELDKDDLIRRFTCSVCGYRDELVSGMEYCRHCGSKVVEE